MDRTWCTSMALWTLIFAVVIGNGVSGTEVTTPDPETNPDLCKLSIWFQNNNVKDNTLTIREGDTVELVCQERCEGERLDFEPRLLWTDTYFRQIHSIAGRRIYTEDTGGNMLLKLFIHSVTHDVLGKYMCRGTHTQGFVNLSIESPAAEFRMTS